METQDVAIVGIENSHAEEIIRYLNVERPGHVPVRVTALVAGEDARTRELAELGGIERIVADSADLLGSIDALIVTSRDGALHRAHAVPFLEAGTPVWVDKPLAASVADAKEIVAAAERGGAILTSSSTLRWLADTEAIAEGMASIGELQKYFYSALFSVCCTAPRSTHDFLQQIIPQLIPMKVMAIRDIKLRQESDKGFIADPEILFEMMKKV